MTSMRDFRNVKNLIELAHQMKLKIGTGYQNFGVNDESIGVYINDSTDERSYPPYSRNVLLFKGSAEECISFISGMQTYKKYVGMLGFEKKIAVAEEKYYDKLQGDRLIDAVRSGKDGGIDAQREKIKNT